jgi:hypothetical protein
MVGWICLSVWIANISIRYQLLKFKNEFSESLDGIANNKNNINLKTGSLS